jgi:hypothetical protein
MTRSSLQNYLWQVMRPACRRCGCVLQRCCRVCVHAPRACCVWCACPTPAAELNLRHARPPRTNGGHRGAYAKWHLRSSASSDGLHKELTRKRPLRRQRLDTGKYPLPHKAESEVQPCTNSFHWNDGCTQLIHQPTSFIRRVLHRKRSQAVQAKLSPGPTHPPEQVIRDPTR